MNLERVSRIAERLCAERGWNAPSYVDQGASAAVFEVTTEDGPAALKVYDPEFFVGENALIEAKRIELQQELRGHDCPYLVEVKDAGALGKDGTWFLLMEFCPWRSLEKCLGVVPPDKIHLLVKQLVSAILYLDARGLVHRDIKPANIVVSPDYDRLKLLDFGVIRRVAHDEGSGTDGHRFIATAQYSPPEFLARDELPGAAGFQAINVYQVGAVLHDLITGTALFAEEKATKNKFKLYKAVTERRPRVVSASVPPRLIALCLAALDKDPSRRIGGVGLDDFLNDADDLGALRRRLRRNGEEAIPAPTPSLAIWRPHVRAWAAEAAQLEFDTLGALTMKATPLTRGQRWALTFASAEATIFVDLVPNGGELATYVLSHSTIERGPPLLTIDANGPSLPEAGIPGALAAQFLYALDAALALPNQSASEPETSR